MNKKTTDPFEEAYRSLMKENGEDFIGHREMSNNGMPMKMDEFISKFEASADQIISALDEIDLKKKK